MARGVVARGWCTRVPHDGLPAPVKLPVEIASSPLLEMGAAKVVGAPANIPITSWAFRGGALFAGALSGADRGARARRLSCVRVVARGHRAVRACGRGKCVFE